MEEMIKQTGNNGAYRLTTYFLLLLFYCWERRLLPSGAQLRPQAAFKYTRFSDAIHQFFFGTN